MLAHLRYPLDPAQHWGRFTTHVLFFSVVFISPSKDACLKVIVDNKSQFLHGLSCAPALDIDIPRELPEFVSLQMLGCR